MQKQMLLRLQERRKMLEGFVKGTMKRMGLSRKVVRFNRHEELNIKGVEKIIFLPFTFYCKLNYGTFFS